MVSGPTEVNGRGSIRASRCRAALLVAALAWAEGPTLLSMERRWAIDPRYSHGFLVPAFALVMYRRGRTGPVAPAGPVAGRERWLGVALIAISAALQWGAARVFLPWFEGIALLPMLAGAVLVLGGRGALREAGPSIAFLAFMVPLPHRVEVALGAPLQHLATLGSTWALQMLGLPAVAEGEVITLGEGRIGVVEACNGLGMLFAFAAMTTAVAILSRRPVGERVLIVLSAAPIALVANVARISLTGFLHETAGSGTADAVYHDLSGWLMMPLALLLLWVELRVLSGLLVARPLPRA